MDGIELVTMASGGVCVGGACTVRDSRIVDAHLPVEVGNWKWWWSWTPLWQWRPPHSLDAARGVVHRGKRPVLMFHHELPGKVMDVRMGLYWAPCNRPGHWVVHGGHLLSILTRN